MAARRGSILGRIVAVPVRRGRRWVAGTLLWATASSADDRPMNSVQGVSEQDEPVATKHEPYGMAVMVWATS
jgi:hypothetical protein